MEGTSQGHVWMTHGHGKQGEDWLWDRGVGWAGEQKGKNWDNCNGTIKYLIKK